jgi:hypothetical protein
MDLSLDAGSNGGFRQELLEFREERLKMDEFDGAKNLELFPLQLVNILCIFFFFKTTSIYSCGVNLN